ncbi:ankyrin repeat domain-containing protein [Spiroplasma endosymbiont of Tricholauxania praeusta]|uniref:ankyrin repeat domain-containing protein n=1 Tax=Spiroplasma endosymbiont of Tricholauxania praeusta TaxID=3066296 RepID=UPI0030D080E4
MLTLNYLIDQFQNKKIQFSIIEDFMNNPNISDEEVIGLDNNNRNALHNSFLLDLDEGAEIEDEYNYDPHEEGWETSSELIEFRTNKIKLINWLINFKKNDKKFLNQQDIEGNSPLHLAIMKQYIVDWKLGGEFKNIAKQLINNSQVNPNLVNLQNETPFCKLLIQEINKADAYPTNKEIRELVNDFQNNSHFNINSVNIKNQNLLHIIAKEGNKTDFRINFAITKKTNFYQIDDNGNIPYEIAILNNNFDMLEIIENCKYFDINTPIDEFNNTILHRAIRSNNKKIIRTLLLKNENGDLEINFDIKNKNNEKPFKFEDMIIDWLHQLPRNQNQIEMMIIDFLITNECNYNNYITREGLTWWTLAIKYNLKEVTNYLVNSVLTDINKIDSNPFKNKNYLLDNEIKEEVDSMLDDLSYVDSKIITFIKKLPNCPNFNELQKDVLEQRVTAFHNFKKYQTDQNLSDNEKAIFKIYLDAILDEDDTNWSEEKKTDFNKVKEWLTKEEVNKEKRKLENTEKNDSEKRRKLSIG